MPGLTGVLAATGLHTPMVGQQSIPLYLDAVWVRWAISGGNAIAWVAPARWSLGLDNFPVAYPSVPIQGAFTLLSSLPSGFLQFQGTDIVTKYVYRWRISVARLTVAGDPAPTKIILPAPPVSSTDPPTFLGVRQTGWAKRAALAAIQSLSAPRR